MNALANRECFPPRDDCVNPWLNPLSSGLASHADHRELVIIGMLVTKLVLDGDLDCGRDGCAAPILRHCADIVCIVGYCKTGTSWICLTYVGLDLCLVEPSSFAKPPSFTARFDSHLMVHTLPFAEPPNVSWFGSLNVCFPAKTRRDAIG